MATKKIYYIEEAQPTTYDEANPLASDQLTHESEASEPRCSNCGELLAWHEQPCTTEGAGLTVENAENQAEPKAKATASTYAYNLGHQVQPIPQAPPRTIIWRGQLKERHPQTGLVHRVNVYRLDDNFWDCHHEEDLQLAA